MRKLRRKLLSQNFLRDEQLVTQLVANSSIGKTDTVIEIGPGQGIITKQLLRKAHAVIGIEIDQALNHFLLKRFVHHPNLILYEQSFSDSPLPITPYKVFANLPFAIEGHAIRKLIDASNPPLDAYLIMRAELAYRLGGIRKESMFSLIHKPWFDFSVHHVFRKYDFTPSTKVSAVMLRFIKKKDPSFPWSEKVFYQKFITRGFGQGDAVFRNLLSYYRKDLLLNAFEKYSIGKHARPLHLSSEQWVLLLKILGR